MILGEDGIATADVICNIELKVEKLKQMVDVARNGKNPMYGKTSD